LRIRDILVIENAKAFSKQKEISRRFLGFENQRFSKQKEISRRFLGS